MSPSKPAGGRSDGREQLLLYLAPDVKREMKKLALDRDEHLYVVVESILREHLEKLSNKTGGG